MGIQTSGAANRMPTESLPVGATIRAIIFVTVVSTLLSQIVLQAVLALFVESDAAGYVLSLLMVAVFRTSLGAIPGAVAFVLIFGFARRIYIERWLLYGLLWSLIPALGLVSVTVNAPRLLISSALASVLTVGVKILSAYLTKTIYLRAES